MSSTMQPGAEPPVYPSILGPGLRAVVSSMFTRTNSWPRRSFRRDVIPLVARFKPPAQVLGEEFIPKGGPCLLLNNHYYRPGFDTWHRCMAISAVVPVEVYWIITSALTYPGKTRGSIMEPLSRWVLARLARAYGFCGMPPMPPRPRDTQARAESVRRVVNYIRNAPQAFIGLAPEGRDILTGKLDWPPPGAGRFVLQLAKMGLKLVPVGAYEEGRLWLNFGPAFELEVPPGLPRDDMDRCASRQVMEHIARLLPERLRGEFGGTHGDIYHEN